ncbi:uncharacterized protein LOC144343467 [Saccoglossus kowalevskii]
MATNPITGNKRDFGSFHSSNVQDLIEISHEEYEAPKIPVELPTFTSHDTPHYWPVFGKEIRKKHFLLEDFTFLNHGAFGAALKDAVDAKHQWQYYIERQPVRFMDRDVLPHLVCITRKLAQFVGCDKADIVLVSNATTAMNSVIKSIKFKPGDIIYCLNTTYGAVKKLLKFISEETGAVIQEETLEFPLSEESEIINKVKATLSPGTRLAVFDHIPSNTPFIMPIKELVEICHARDVPVLVDGAHSLGSLSLNIVDIGADYYVTNAHKWFCAPKGCAFLYVRKELQQTVRPLVVSHGFGSGFSAEYMWPGLIDFTSFLSLYTVLDFWNSVGPDKIRHYIHSLAKQAAELLLDKWKTKLIAPMHMFGSMVLVQLPSDLHKNKICNYDLAETIQNKLFHQFKIEVPIKAIQNELYVRISAHIYNDICEYEVLRDAVTQLTTN